MAASRSETPTWSVGKGSAVARMAALGIADPSNNAMLAAPAGAIPDRILRYLSRSDMHTTIP